MLESLLKLIVMFFRLINLLNLLVIFQAMMNKLLQDLINTGQVVSFIDDVIVETKEEKGHYQSIEEVLRRMEENNLYVKLEKYK